MVEVLQCKPLLLIELLGLVVRQVRDLVDRTKIRNRVAVTVETPAHGQFLGPGHDFHLVDSTMTGHATHPTIYMCAVIEIRIVGNAIDPDPFNRQAGFIGLLDLLELRTFRPNPLVAVHASLRRRDCSMGRFFNRVVTVPTIHPKFTGVQCVTERYRLFGLIADLEGLRTEAVRDEHHRVQGEQTTNHQ